MKRHGRVSRWTVWGPTQDYTGVSETMGKSLVVSKVASEDAQELLAYTHAAAPVHEIQRAGYKLPCEMQRFYP